MFSQPIKATLSLLYIALLVAVQPCNAIQRARSVQATKAGATDAITAQIDRLTKEYEAHRYPNAERECETAISLLPNNPQTAGARRVLSNLLGLCYIKNGKYAKGESIFRQLLKGEASLTKHEKSTCLDNLAMACLHNGKIAEAESDFRKALSLCDPNGGRYYTLNNLAGIYLDQQKYQAAKPLLEEALAAARTHSDKSAMATICGNLGVVESSLGNKQRAAELYEEELQIDESIGAPNDERFGKVNCNLASLYFAQNKLPQAEALSKKAIQIWEHTLGPTHPNLVTPLMTLAMVSHTRKEFDQSEQCFERAIKISEKRFDAEQPPIKLLLAGYALVLLDTNKFEKASSIARRAAAIPDDARCKEYPFLQSALPRIAEIASSNALIAKDIKTSASAPNGSSEQVQERSDQPVAVRTEPSNQELSALKQPTAVFHSENVITSAIPRAESATNISPAEVPATPIPTPATLPAPTSSREAPAEYLSQIGLMLRSHWYPSKGDENKGIVLVLQIARDGTVIDHRLAGANADEIAGKSIEEALADAGRLPALPEGTAAPLDLQVKFDSNLFLGKASGITQRY